MAAAPPFVRLFQYCPAAPQEPRESNWDSWLQNERIAAYVQECRGYYPQYIHKPIRWNFGDNISWMTEPTVVKSRIIGDRNAVLMPLNAARHWGRHAPGTLPPKLWTPETLPGMDIPFAKKAQRIVWRGSTPATTMATTRTPAPSWSAGGTSTTPRTSTWRSTRWCTTGNEWRRS